MTDPMTGGIDRVEVITSVQRRRRWSVEEKVRIVDETYLPGMSVSLVARRHGIAGNQQTIARAEQRHVPGRVAGRMNPLPTDHTGHVVG